MTNVCHKCSDCCGRILPLSLNDRKIIYDYLRKHPHVKEDIFNVRQSTEGESGSVLDCPFLDVSKTVDRCRIYEARPFVCRTYHCENGKRFNIEKMLEKNHHMSFKVMDMRKFIEAVQ